MPAAIRFKPVRTARVSNLIIEQLKSAIHAGTLKPGDRLPSERELAEGFQASRISIREALKRLEASGLVSVKVGSGVFVAEMDSTPMSESLFSILRIQNGTIDDLTEARLIFEPSVARLAAEKVTPEDIVLLEENTRQAEIAIKANLSAYERNIEFHSLIAQATRNLTITLTMKTMLDVMKDMSADIARDNPPQNVNKAASQVLRVHKEIVKALKETDSERVYNLMQKDILRIQSGLKKLKSVAE
jgi:GntR family transcriptional regulator, transcriptional repressor for pyruvate dehydrogenase complex